MNLGKVSWIPGFAGTFLADAVNLAVLLLLPPRGSPGAAGQ